MISRDNIGHNLQLGAICAALALVPLVYMHEIYEYALLPKRFALFACAVIAVLGWLLRVRTENAIQIPAGPAVFFLMAYTAIIAGGMLNTTHPLDSFVEITYHISLVSLFVLCATLRPADVIAPVVWTVVLTGLTVGIIGILQYHDLAFVQIPTNGHPSATFGFRNFAAMYLICAIPLALYAQFSTCRALWQWLAACSWALMGAYLIYTRTRGAWVGFGIAFLCTAILWIFRPDIRRAWRDGARSHLWPAGAALALIIALSGLPARFDNVGLQRFDEKKTSLITTAFSTFNPAADRGRRHMWGNTLDMIADHPVFGVGPGGWKRHYPIYDQGTMIRRNTAPASPHNDYLWIAAEYGLLGLGCYIGFLIGLFRALIHLPQPRLILPFAAVLLAPLGHAMFSFPKEHPQVGVVFFLVAGLVTGMQTRNMRTVKGWARYALPLLTIAATFGATFLCARHIQFDRHYLRALLAEDAEDWATVRREAGAGLNQGVFRTHLMIINARAQDRASRYAEAEASYWRALAQEPNNWQAHNGLGIVLKRQDRFEEAEKHHLQALRYFPGKNNADARHIYTNLGALYNSMGKPDRAEAIYRQLLAIQPDHPGANNNMGNIYLQKGMIDSALTAYHRAISGDSTLVQAHVNLSTIHLNANRLDESFNHAAQAARHQPQNPRIAHHLGRVLEARKMIPEAEHAYRLAVQQAPDFAQAHFDLANVLFSLRRYGEAMYYYENFVNIWEGDRKFIDFATEQMAECRRMQR